MNVILKIRKLHLLLFVHGVTYKSHYEDLTPRLGEIHLKQLGKFLVTCVAIYFLDMNFQRNVYPMVHASYRYGFFLNNRVALNKWRATFSTIAYVFLLKFKMGSVICFTSHNKRVSLRVKLNVYHLVISKVFPFCISK